MANTKSANVERRKPKKWIVALLLSVLLGSLGVDRFYMGYIGTGILKLITFGGFGVWWLIDLILIATKHDFKKVKWVE
jgi:TM2 domain-containing membrane protein YozV